MRADVIPEGGTTNVLERLAVCLGDPPRNRGCNFATLRGNVEMSTEAKIAIDLALLAPHLRSHLDALARRMKSYGLR